MENKIDGNRLVAVPVGKWSESETSYHLLVDQNRSKDGFSRGVWFTKKLCKLRVQRKEGRLPMYYLIAPLWMIRKNNIKIQYKLWEEKVN